MTNEATLEKMQLMKFNGMVQAFGASMQTDFSKELSTDELIAYLIDAEWEDRYNRKLKRLIKTANFRYQATIQQIDFHKPRNLDRNQLMRLSDCRWLKKGENVLITGATGVGKSFLACAFGHQACLEGFKTLYFNCIKLFSKLKYAKAEGTYIKEMKKIQNQQLLILDDFGLHPIDEHSKLMLLEILEDRYGAKSTLMTSQLPVEQWYDIIKTPTVADAICDRLVHNAYQIQLQGESMRKIKKNRSG